MNSWRPLLHQATIRTRPIQSTCLADEALAGAAAGRCDFGLAIVLSLIGEQAGWPAQVICGINILSFVSGGIFGVKTALESLRERRIDVDMLMVLAALGAGSR